MRGPKLVLTTSVVWARPVVRCEMTEVSAEVLFQGNMGETGEADVTVGEDSRMDVVLAFSTERDFVHETSSELVLLIAFTSACETLWTLVESVLAWVYMADASKLRELSDDGSEESMGVGLTVSGVSTMMGEVVSLLVDSVWNS